ncbi:Hypothetical protein ETEE_3197 [Edwardsiella anguillarum ET080813]|uniref:Uncharacterized protein n=1 Tax=Edwardsiella anguillarum ET080813 TaxID=667120 RepID=A0A076LVT4_9GAMM|nr:Hypothetical protein ETEE_3197 [Edwardsiella anguillarum ET080813]
MVDYPSLLNRIRYMHIHSMILRGRIRVCRYLRRLFNIETVY